MDSSHRSSGSAKTTNNSGRITHQLPHLFFPFYSLRSCDPSLSGSCSREEQTIIKQTVTYYITPVFAVLLLLLLVGYGSQGEGGGNVILPLGFLDTPIICRWSEAGDKEALEASEQACC